MRMHKRIVINKNRMIIVPSGVEPLSSGPGPKRITTTPRDYTI